MSANESKRVALLARAGRAREQLRTALHESGAEIVLEDDPNSIDAQTLGDSAPQVVLIALEPAIEEGLSRLELVLHDPTIAVIFDEAELAARREGWESQRWARHLAAKLHGHHDVLPPGREEEATPQLEPGLPPTPAQLHANAGIGLHLEEAVDAASELPRDAYAFTEIAKPGFDQVVDADQWLSTDSSGQNPDSAGEVSPSEPLPLPPAATAATPPAATTGLTLELMEMEPVAASRTPGAVVVFAGIGGPDAVRKLLAELPLDFSRPVLIQLRLDGGRYDNLIRQMARVAQMPVVLAEAGLPAEPGNIYVMPAELGLAVDNGAVSFRSGDAEDGKALIEALPPADSAVLLLSGADRSLAEPAAALAAQGALVQGQSTDGCYDPAASRALAEHGAELAAPAQLARHLIERW
ncbi:MAG TPA: chemotaxis protein CheB [Pseudoxanthomonas sp.]|nr:chemotaxis protein CheB [Pseudoxanthomonas sp.]